MTTKYQWHAEETSYFGDVEAEIHGPTIGHVAGPGRRYALQANRDGKIDWAYVEAGRLTEHFDSGERVPTRFHREIARFYGNATISYV